ncbi:recombinase family protein [Streptomyces jumonjinensis]|uniref:Recombinase domain-containing protein n=1 Tax=Streptomyces jumonjinensis TaxID=1945 RepID=A0A646KVU1_STRJU|nr:recombinase family protein [Streptomyces jumonjinensis]MQT05126.1 hypothetical protein [Streptomyces jumonjinensis]
MGRLFGFEDAAHTRVRESEAEALPPAAVRRLAGQSYDEITLWINQAGYRTARGGEFRAGGLAILLDNPAIAGLREDADGDLVETGLPAIITREQFVAIRVMRRKNQPDFERKPSREYLVPGRLGVCGLCAYEIASTPANSGSRGYRCPPSTKTLTKGCGKVRVNADGLERHLAEQVLAELAKPEVSALIGRARDDLLAEAQVLREQADVLRKRQRALGEQYASPSGLSLTAFHAADKQFTKEIKQAMARARQLEMVQHVPVGDVPNLVAWWQHAPLVARQGVLVLMLDEVALFPASARGSRVVDSNRVRLTWRVWGQGAAEGRV